jgi:hypothetical protein
VPAAFPGRSSPGSLLIPPLPRVIAHLELCAPRRVAARRAARALPLFGGDGELSTTPPRPRVAKRVAGYSKFIPKFIPMQFGEGTRGNILPI